MATLDLVKEYLAKHAAREKSDIKASDTLESLDVHKPSIDFMVAMQTIAGANDSTLNMDAYNAAETVSDLAKAIEPRQ